MIGKNALHRVHFVFLLGEGLSRREAARRARLKKRVKIGRGLHSGLAKAPIRNPLLLPITNNSLDFKKVLKAIATVLTTISRLLVAPEWRVVSPLLVVNNHAPGP